MPVSAMTDHSGLVKGQVVEKPFAKWYDRRKFMFYYKRLMQATNGPLLQIYRSERIKVETKKSPRGQKMDQKKERRS